MCALVHSKLHPFGLAARVSVHLREYFPTVIDEGCRIRVFRVPDLYLAVGGPDNIRLLLNKGGCCVDKGSDEADDDTAFAGKALCLRRV
jgi:hypothetical protein